MRLEGIQIGDIVEVDRLGRRFHALVIGNAAGGLSIQPFDRRGRMRDRRIRRPRVRRLGGFAWRRVTPTVVAALSEQRLGVRVDAAVPLTLAGHPQDRTVIALAGDRVWVLDDESSPLRPRIGHVLARWARRGLVSHVEPSSTVRRLSSHGPRMARSYED